MIIDNRSKQQPDQSDLEQKQQQQPQRHPIIPSNISSNRNKAKWLFWRASFSSDSKNLLNSPPPSGLPFTTPTHMYSSSSSSNNNTIKNIRHLNRHHFRSPPAAVSPSTSGKPTAPLLVGNPPPPPPLPLIRSASVDPAPFSWVGPFRRRLQARRLRRRRLWHSSPGPLIRQQAASKWRFRRRAPTPEE